MKRSYGRSSPDTLAPDITYYLYNVHFPTPLGVRYNATRLYIPGLAGGEGVFVGIGVPCYLVWWEVYVWVVVTWFGGSVRIAISREGRTDDFKHAAMTVWLVE